MSINTRDINKIDWWLAEELENTKFELPSNPPRIMQSFPIVDKIKYYEMIEKCLEKYIVEKLREWNRCRIIPNKIEINLQSLQEIFCNITTFEERQKIFSNFCSYILRLISSLQGHDIGWRIETEEQYIDSFTVKGEKGLISSLYSHKDSDNLKIFIYLLTILKVECYHMEGYTTVPAKIKK